MREKHKIKNKIIDFTERKIQCCVLPYTTHFKVFIFYGYVISLQLNLKRSGAVKGGRERRALAHSLMLVFNNSVS